MAAVVFIGAIAIYQGYRKSSQIYYRRAAKKNGFATLPTDTLGRPLDPESGERLTKNKARAVAEHRRELERSHNAMARNSDKSQFGEDLPAYKKQSQEDSDYQMALRMSQEPGLSLPDYNEAAGSLPNAVALSSKREGSGKGLKLFTKRKRQA